MFEQIEFGGILVGLFALGCFGLLESETTSQYPDDHRTSQHYVQQDRMFPIYYPIRLFAIDKLEQLEHSVLVS